MACAIEDVNIPSTGLPGLNQSAEGYCQAVSGKANLQFGKKLAARIKNDKALPQRIGDEQAAIIEDVEGSRPFRRFISATRRNR
jgi:hypothetical protein